MDHTKESSDFSFELLVSIKEGLESLEPGLRKKAIGAIQKRLRAKDAQSRSSGTPSDLERQFRKLMTQEKKKEVAMKNIVEAGKVLVVVEKIHSSNLDHKYDVLTFKSGDVVTANQLASGKLLAEGESLEVFASIHIGGGEYRQGYVTVTNHGGIPQEKSKAGERLVAGIDHADSEDEPYERILYDPAKHGKPEYRDFCPREWFSEWEEYAYAMVEYLDQTWDIPAGWEAVRSLGWIGTNNDGALAMAIVAAKLHEMGENILPALKQAGEDYKLREVKRQLGLAL